MSWLNLHAVQLPRPGTQVALAEAVVLGLGVTTCGSRWIGMLFGSSQLPPVMHVHMLHGVGIGSTRCGLRCIRRFCVSRRHDWVARQC
jgi:hypothetical protein